MLSFLCFLPNTIMYVSSWQQYIQCILWFLWCMYCIFLFYLCSQVGNGIRNVPLKHVLPEGYPVHIVNILQTVRCIHKLIVYILITNCVMYFGNCSTCHTVHTVHILLNSYIPLTVNQKIGVQSFWTTAHCTTDRMINCTSLCEVCNDNYGESIYKISIW